MKALATFVIRHRWAVIALAGLAGVAAIPLARLAEERLDVSGRIAGSESAAVEEALATRFDSPFARSALLVLSGVPSPSRADGREALEAAVIGLRGLPGVRRTYSFLDTADPMFLPQRGAGTFVVVGLDPSAPADALVPRLRERARGLEVRLRHRFRGATLRFTGEPVLNLDFRRASATEVRAAEARALPLSALLLMLAFGALVASLLPLAAGSLAILLTLAAATLLTEHFPLSVTLQSVTSMLGLGLGIDYGLLTVSRFREARRTGLGDVAAALEAGTRAGATVALSGTAVCIGFLGLLLVPVGELRSLAVGGLLVVAASVTLAVTLLPALLAVLGPRVDAGRIAVPVGLARNRIGSALAARESWRGWAQWVARHPRVVLLLAGTPLVLLAAEGRRLRTGMPEGDWLPATLQSIAAVRDLRDMGRGGVLQEVQIVVDLPEEVTALGAVGWEAQRRWIDALGRDPRVASVRSLRAVAGERAEDRSYVGLMPGPVKSVFVAAEGDAVLIGLVPREGATPHEVAALVREIRLGSVAALGGPAGARLRVGGLPAFNVDYEEAVAGRLSTVVGLVVGGTLAVLFLAFRSLLIPLKAVALNLLSVGAALGALVIVFQDGIGSAWLGLAGPTGTVFPAVPVLVFAVVFGLSMDYEVFLVARVAEARRDGLDERDAVAEGLARTGRVITSAAAIMVAVFGSFAAGGVLLVKMLGFTLAVAVLLDATVIRLALGPALLLLAGRWNWWPGAGKATDRAHHPNA